MSSILDALKKSEAERQRGVPPTLSTPIMRQGQPARKQRPAWLLPAIAGVALVAAWAGGLFSGAGTEADDPVAESRPVSASPAVSDDAAAAVPPAPVPVTAPAQVDRPEAEPSTPPATEPAQVSFGPFRPRHLPTAPAQDPAAAPAADGQPAVPDAADIPTDAEAAAAAAAPAPVAEAPPAAAQPAAPASAPVAPTPPPAPAAAQPGNAVPTFNQLPYAVRREIPQIALTMHMYSADPERRFAIINGVRARDGQPLEGGLEVVEIRPDGVLIRFKDTDFLYPSRG